MKNSKVVLLVILMTVMTIILSACSNSSSSGYDLHNKDGSLNMEYIADMNEYFKEHPEKLP